MVILKHQNDKLASFKWSIRRYVEKVPHWIELILTFAQNFTVSLLHSLFYHTQISVIHNGLSTTQDQHRYRGSANIPLAGGNDPSLLPRSPPLPQPPTNPRNGAPSNDLGFRGKPGITYGPPVIGRPAWKWWR